MFSIDFGDYQSQNYRTVTVTEKCLRELALKAQGVAEELPLDSSLRGE